MIGEMTKTFRERISDAIAAQHEREEQSRRTQAILREEFEATARAQAERSFQLMDAALKDFVAALTDHGYDLHLQSPSTFFSTAPYPGHTLTLRGVFPGNHWATVSSYDQTQTHIIDFQYTYHEPVLVVDSDLQKRAPFMPPITTKEGAEEVVSYILAQLGIVRSQSE